MLVKDIVRSAAGILQAEDEVAAIDGGAYSGAEVTALVKAFNLAASELASAFPLYARDTVTTDSGTVELSALSHTPVRVVKVAANGRAVRFSAGGAGIRTGRAGRYEITYTYVPDERGITDSAELGGLCDATVAAYLTARNYCLMTGRTDEAMIWDQRYADETGKRAVMRSAALPRRSWR